MCNPCEQAMTAGTWSIVADGWLRHGSASQIWISVGLIGPSALRAVPIPRVANRHSKP